MLRERNIARRQFVVCDFLANLFSVSIQTFVEVRFFSRKNFPRNMHWSYTCLFLSWMLFFFSFLCGCLVTSLISLDASNKAVKLLLAQATCDAVKYGTVVAEECFWSIKLHHAPLVHHQNFIAVDNGVQPVRDGDGGELREVCADNFLHALVGHAVQALPSRHQRSELSLRRRQTSLTFLFLQTMSHVRLRERYCEHPQPPTPSAPSSFQ